ncbi:developmental pluripotency-associated protein 4 [Tamandua tetradactyla]|uniref:developmental pluripotency-associated protein 4 n=1 Tax=Tamandua tetradactyla TaxID=48850 RepID=UPI004053F008
MTSRFECFLMAREMTPMDEPSLGTVGSTMASLQKGGKEGLEQKGLLWGTFTSHLLPLEMNSPAVPGRPQVEDGLKGPRPKDDKNTNKGLLQWYSNGNLHKLIVMMNAQLDDDTDWADDYIPKSRKAYLSRLNSHFAPPRRASSHTASIQSLKWAGQPQKCSASSLGTLVILRQVVHVGHHEGKLTKLLPSQWNSTEKSGEECVTLRFEPVSVETKEEQRPSSEPSTSGLPKTSAKGTKRKKSKKDDKASCSQENAPGNNSPKPRKKIAIPPLPSKLPPVNLLHRDILRAWCQQLKLSTKGQKLEAYRRICEYAYPNQKDIPVTAKEAKILTQSQRKSLGEMPLEQSEKKNMSSEGTDPSEMAPPPQEGVSAQEKSGLLQGVNTVVVTTSAQEAVLASWTRIAARAGRMEAMESPQEAYGVRWCVVHGRSLPANTDGWVHLQFHAGQAWVPEKQGRVSALFLLPACNFPPPHLEDNMLCPRCVQRFTGNVTAVSAVSSRPFSRMQLDIS